MDSNIDTARRLVQPLNNDVASDFDFEVLDSGELKVTAQSGSLDYDDLHSYLSHVVDAQYVLTVQDSGANIAFQD